MPGTTWPRRCPVDFPFFRRGVALAKGKRKCLHFAETRPVDHLSFCRGAGPAILTNKGASQLAMTGCRFFCRRIATSLQADESKSPRAGGRLVARSPEGASHKLGEQLKSARPSSTKRETRIVIKFRSQLTRFASALWHPQTIYSCPTKPKKIA